VAAVVLDEIGPWSLVKLDIVREYAQAYSRILSAQQNPGLHHVYIDAFAGAGLHALRATGDYVPGSPLNALLVRPPFREYHFIDLARQKTAALRSIVGGRTDVFVHEGDCNSILPKTVFPLVDYRRYRRGLCLLDPYGLDLNWEVIRQAGQMRSLEIFLNFPLLDMNRNVLRKDPDAATSTQVARMDAFWGDHSWWDAAYQPSRQARFFGEAIEKTDKLVLVHAFQKRLREQAGFEYVPDPMPMHNSKDAVLYYLFFASHKPVAAEIVQDIFRKHGLARSPVPTGLGA